MMKTKSKMKKTICLLSTAALLSSCGIYNKYKPVTTVPEDLYGNETIVTDTLNNIGNLSWRELFTDPLLQNLIAVSYTHLRAHET